MKRTFKTLALFFGLSSIAFGGLIEGHYSSNEGYFTDPEIRAWASDYTLLTSLTYNSRLRIPVSYHLVARGFSGEYERYRATGTMLLEYTSGMVCPYALDAEILAKGTQFFVRSRQQANICESNCVACQPANYVWVEHVAPYELIQ
ncbi:MAG: hypothetical protein HYZ71_15995 [Deltaproteobacteria bacterium]|nr:hypothetical protein [Deltaproteobacteria bacterium]